MELLKRQPLPQLLRNMAHLQRKHGGAATVDAGMDDEVAAVEDVRMDAETITDVTREGHHRELEGGSGDNYPISKTTSQKSSKLR